ncbi:MAG: ATP-binding protein [Sneathiella sp.]
MRQSAVRRDAEEDLLIERQNLEENVEKRTAELKKEIAERDRIEDALYFVAQGGWQSDGSDFLKSLVKYLGEKLAMDYVFVDELLEDNKTAKTVALYSMGEFPENISYPLEGTPCANVIGKTLCCYTRQVQESFPEDEMLVDMDAESYVGIPLWSSENKPLGLIAVMSQGRIEFPQAIETILKIVAVRAAHELERRQEELKRQTLEERLRHVQKMEAVGQLTGGIAHDFNNILGIIAGNLEIIQTLAPDNTQIQVRSENALKGTERAANITRKLLGFSQTDAHKIKVISVNQFAQNLGGFIEKSLTASITVQTKLSEGLWPIKADPGELQDAILNLSLNARDAMPNGGILKIETINETLDTRFLSKQSEAKAGDYVRISITDTGVGIADEIKNKILEPFFTTKNQRDGSGLGLSMVYGFVQRSNGYLDILSRIGQGTTIHLYLPRANNLQNEDLEAAETAEVEEKQPNGSETILIVDDEPALLDVAASFLDQLGYTTLTAGNGDQALQLIKDSPKLDLLFSDVVMPGNMNGYELADKSRNARPDLKILLASGFTKKLEKQDKYFELRTIKLLVKPYNLLEMAKAVRSVFDDEQTHIQTKLD